MKLLIRLILITVFAYFLPFYLPWWSLVVIAFIIGFLINGTGFGVFVSGFLGGGLTWMIYAWYLDVTTNSILSVKVVQLFPFEDTLFLIIATGLIGALCGGFGALSGSAFRDLFIKHKPKSYYN